MAEQVYEAMFILDSARFARESAEIQSHIESIVTDAGGELLVSRIWEERRLAYPINKHRKGVYWLMYFRIKTDQLNPMNRKCELSESIIRHMFLKVHPKLVEPIVAHASGVVAEPEAEAEAPAEDEAATETPATDAAATETPAATK